MTLPKDAILEKILPGKIAIYDVSHILPMPRKPRMNTRDPGTKIVRVFFHYSAALGADGYEGAENSVKYVINRRNFGARPYHFWLAYKPDLDKDDNIIIYRLAKDEERAWHTGNEANNEGVGVVWQGDLYPDADGPPTEEQYKMAEALTNYLIERYGLSLPDGLSFHAEGAKWGGRNKSSCPGPYVQKWVKERRNRIEETNKHPDPQDDLNDTKKEVDNEQDVVKEPNGKQPDQNNKIMKPNKEETGTDKQKNWLQIIASFFAKLFGLNNRS